MGEIAILTFVTGAAFIDWSLAERAYREESYDKAKMIVVKYIREE